jgi:HK97 gp10 family phage protein
MPNETEIVLEYTHFGEIGASMAREIDGVCHNTALDIQARAQLAIQNPPKSGRIYKRGNVLHQASAPGEAPATDTSALVNSAYTKKIADADYETGFTAKETDYARHLEFGTAKMEPRPYLRPAVEAVRDAFIRAIKRIVERP